MNADVSVNFLQRDTDGKYSKRLGDADSVPVLHTGDRYKLHIAARRDAYLYIVHFDSKGVWRMLMAQDRDGAFADSDDRHHLLHGTSVVLPGTDASGRVRAYALDNNTGTESFHFVLSSTPLPKLKDAYESALGTNPMASARSTAMRDALRGIPPAVRGAPPLPEPDLGSSEGQHLVPLLQCQAPNAGCSAEFVIRHLERREP